MAAGVAGALMSFGLAACVSTSPPGEDTGVDVSKPAVEISEATTANGPFLATGPDGTVTANWSENNDIVRRVSVDGGETFGVQQVVRTVSDLGNVAAGTQQPQPLAATIDEDGHTHLLIQVSDPLDANRSDIYYTDVERYALPVEKALMAGGHNLSGQGQLIVNAYDPRTQQWEPVNRTALGSGLFCDAGVPTAADADRRWDQGAAAYAGRVYETGGEDLSGTIATVQYLDPDRLIWLGESALPGPRAGHALVSDGTFLYAIGGRDASVALGTIARMDPSAGTSYLFDSVGTLLSCSAPASSPWVTLGPGLGVGRVYLDAVVVQRTSGERDLYVIGGETFAGNPLSNVDAFRMDPGGVLTPLAAPPQLPDPRSRHRAVAVGERIYVMGGTSDGTDVLDSVLVLDLASPSPAWLSIGSMPSPRREFVAAVLEGQVYAMAGRDNEGDSVLNTEVDRMDPGTETWTVEPDSTAASLPLGAAVAVVSEPSLPRNVSRQAANATQPALVRAPPPDPDHPEDGDLYVVWRNEAPVDVAEGEAPRTTSDVYLRRSTDNGATFFDPPVRLSGLGALASRNNNFSGNPTVAVGPNGLVHLAWIETGESGTPDQGRQELIYTNCAPNDFSETGLDCGASLLTFSAGGGTGPGAPPPGELKTPTIAVDEAGGVYLAWIDVDGTVPLATASANQAFALNVWFTYRLSIGTFATPVPIGEDLTSRMDELFPPGSVDDPVAEIAKLATRVNTPTIVTDGPGEVNVVWANNGEVRLRRSRDGGQTFLNEAAVAPLVSGDQRTVPGAVYDPVSDRVVTIWQTLSEGATGPADSVDSVVETRVVQPQ